MLNITILSCLLVQNQTFLLPNMILLSDMNRSQKPIDIRRFDYAYGKNEEGYYKGRRQTESDKPPRKKHKWLKRFFIFILLIITVIGAAAATTYFLVDNTRLKGEEEGRVNFVVSGVDKAAKLSDTLMIVSIKIPEDEKEGQYKAAIISVPRDLYLELPPFGMQKINAAYSLGENANNKVAGGGMGLVRRTVEDNFNLDVHYQVAVDFHAFKELVDAVGGVTIDVPNDIYDPYYPGENGGQQIVQFEAGKQKMNGNEALKYARSRQTTTDFDRAARQQQIVMAVKDKILSEGFALDQEKIIALKNVLDDHVKTDMSLPEMLRLAEIGQRLSDKNITRHVLDNSADSLLVESGLNGYTLSPRAGNFSEIQKFIKNIFKQSKDTLPQSHLKDQ